MSIPLIVGIPVITTFIGAGLPTSVNLLIGIWNKQHNKVAGSISQGELKIKETSTNNEFNKLLIETVKTLQQTVMEQQQEILRSHKSEAETWEKFIRLTHATATTVAAATGSPVASMELSSKQEAGPLV